MQIVSSSVVSRLTIFAFVVIGLAACTKDTTSPTQLPGTLQLTASQVKSLDSTAQVIVTANPGRGELTSLVDSTLLVLSAGIQATQLNVTTNLTTKPLYFVGVHRVSTRSTGSFSTWNLVGLDDPSNLTNVIEVSGFAASFNGTAPSAVNGTIADGTGVVNALMLQIGASGAITEWFANDGTVSFSSDANTVACPASASTAPLACAIETMHVHFTFSTPTGTGGASSRQASLPTDISLPVLRLTYAQ